MQEKSAENESLEKSVIPVFAESAQLKEAESPDTISILDVKELYDAAASKEGRGIVRWLCAAKLRQEASRLERRYRAQIETRQRTVSPDKPKLSH